MEEKPFKLSRIWLRLYVLTGILVFIFIGYAYFTKDKNPVQNNTLAALQTTGDTSQKAKQDKEVMHEVEQQTGESPSVDNYFRLGLVYYNAKRYQDCIAMNRKALALNPNLSVAYNNICSAYNALGKWDSAIDACNIAIKIQPDFTLAKNNLAWSYSQLNSSK